MPLPQPEVSRTPLHTRSIRVQSYARDDGLFDLEAELVDSKAYEHESGTRGMQPAGAPIHHMHLRITIDSRFNILHAQSLYDAAPYGTGCTAIEPQYGDLAGMNLMRGFRQSVKARFGRTAGCTHMTELSSVLPTAAVQTMANLPGTSVRDTGSATRPFQLDGCHALRVDGPVVQRYYPRWYLVPEGGSPNPDAAVAAADAGTADSLVSPSSDS